MNIDDAQKIVFTALEKNVQDLKMSQEELDKTLEELGVDSLDVMLVLMDISDAANVEISDDEAESLYTPKKIMDFLCSKK